MCRQEAGGCGSNHMLTSSRWKCKSHNLQDAGRVSAELHPTCQALMHVLLVPETAVHSVCACHGRYLPMGVRQQPTHEPNYRAKSYVVHANSYQSDVFRKRLVA